MSQKELTNREKAELAVYNRTIEALKEVWQNTTPHINLKEQKENIDPNEYTITFSQFNAILKKHDVTVTDNLPLFLNKGPKLIQDYTSLGKLREEQSVIPTVTS